MVSLCAALVLLASAPGAPSAAPSAGHVPAAAAATAPAAAPATDAECHHPASDPAAKADPAPIIRRGAEVPAGAAIAIADVLKDPSAHDGKTVLVEGTVRKACERKGCWMELAAAADDPNPGVRVTFKDYGFFVPLDSQGAKARVQGTVQVTALSEERAKHYASEGAIVPRGSDGKPREVQLVATGVELRR